ncbi:MAG TPA: nucleotidyltransferase domain-containing protein [Bryobacteraceae bacterium]|nr:nucleotidyltransferase domain-containing protein [Bryobacteraceae bacterium]
MDKRLTQLVEKLHAAHDGRLVSVILYGSAATGEHHPKFSDFNVLCVLSEIGPAELAASASAFRWWRDQGSPAPLLLTEQELLTSTDCFAIEFNDIKRQHVLLYGKDVISGLFVENCFYRAQVEHDLRAKLLRLRQKASGVLSDPGLLLRLLGESLSTFCVLFRHALALHGEPAPVRKREAIEAAAQRFGFDAAPFVKLLDVREERVKPREVAAADLFESYLKGISVVIDAVDRLEK